MKTIVCPVCLAEKSVRKAAPYLNSAEPLSKTSKEVFAGTDLYFCESCGFGFVHPPVSREKLSDYYASQYRNPEARYGVEQGTIVFDKYVISTRSLAQIMLARMYRQLGPGDSFLDIGGGNGYSCHAVSMLCPGTDLNVVEPDEHSRRFLESLGVTLYTGSFNGTPVRGLDSMTFSCILMSHVLEHYNAGDIQDVLAHVKKLMAEDSIFICEVPVEDVHAHLGRRNAVVPHLSHFTRESFSIALQKAGFRILYLERAGQDTDWWWRNQHSMYGTDHSIVRRALSRCVPGSIKRIIRRLYKPFGVPSVYDVLVNRDFQANKEGVYLRAVVRPGAG